jgi:hemerythrin-like domain-containing protein
MSIGFGQPAPDFDHPLEMLAACHDRIEDRCRTLHLLVAHLQCSGCDEQAQQAAASVLRYFDTAGEHHHQDEESDLFPRLLAVRPAAASLVERLVTEHGRMRDLWRALREALQAIAHGEAGMLDARTVSEFTECYRRHIVREEGELLPLAAEALGERELRALGKQMAARRGVRDQA